MDINDLLIYVPIVLVAISQIAAAVGKPEWVKGIAVVSKVWDILAANYGKAKNKDD